MVFGKKKKKKRELGSSASEAARDPHFRKRAKWTSASRRKKK